MLNPHPVEHAAAPRLRLDVVGNGMAGIRAVEELLKIAPDLYDITVFGAEPHPNYNRILLSPVLAGEQTIEQIILNPLSWYEDNGIRLHLGRKVTRIDRVKRVVLSDDGSETAYDRAAAGDRLQALHPAGAGQGPAGRDRLPRHRRHAGHDDAAARYRHAVVIGGGLLGLEAANGLMRRGMQVTVVHLMPWLMERQLDDVAGRLLQKSLEERPALPPGRADRDLGRRRRRPRARGALQGRQRGAGAAGGDGRRHPPQHRPALDAGLHCIYDGRGGIAVNDTLQTLTDPRIYAIGECAAHRGTTYGLVAPLFEQGKVCATHLAQFGIGRYSGSQTSTKLKVTGIDLFSAGNFTGGEGCEEIVMSDPCGGVYKKLVIQDDKLVGACLYGDTVDGSWYFKLLREGRSIGDIRDKLMFGESNIGDTGHEGNTRAAAMADSDEVCGCNGVTKGQICKAIKDKGLFTLDEVRKHTKASASCGSCTGLVEQLLMFTAGGDYSSRRRSARCAAAPTPATRTRAGHPRAPSVEHRRGVSPPGWRTPNGCASCRPAINYYLISSWPKEARDDPQSRFINERSHANIQKDGSYSVIPRMWGGETTADELRRIADAVDKYKIRTVKVTGGQRIDLLGVKKEDLPAVWQDIGMPSGHAYAKALRTVKTCVGSEWCRFGTQDSTQMGKDLERALWRMYAPHKVKLAVSGCPRNCAESGIKDVGVIGVESGWEIYVGGNGGIKTEVAQFLCKLKTPAEVLEYSGAFLQLYREEGWYLERTVHYIGRVGLDYVKKRILDDAAGRLALWERLQFSLDGEPDPWFEFSKAQVDLRQFDALPAPKTELVEAK